MSKNKFSDRYTTAAGEKRASVPFSGHQTLWFNTGTLCNLECANCYIESSPKNDRLSYLSLDDVRPYLVELASQKEPPKLIAFTGGEPFLNPHIFEILDAVLELGRPVLVLTNAYKVIKRSSSKLLELQNKYGELLSLRISLDHYTEACHDKERGGGTLRGTLESFKWLWDNGFNLSIAGRSLIAETKESALNGYRALLRDNQISLQLDDSKIVIFPEMIEDEDVPEITTSCWEILSKSPSDQMCASERMIVKKKGKEKAQVQACTLLAYSEEFNLGGTLEEAATDVYLNHPYCAKFCVLGGASCSSTK